MAPVAERADDIPKGQERGARAEQEDFIAQTGGDLSAPLSEPEQDPTIPIVPQELGEFEDRDPGDDDDEEGMSPEDFGLLVDGAGTVEQVRATRELNEWSPILEFIAAQAGASESMRNLAAGLRELRDQ